LVLVQEEAQPMTRDDCLTALQFNNVAAFLEAVAHKEAGNDDNAYRRVVGGQIFDGALSEHPRIAVQTKWGWSSAFGKYQIMAAVPGKVKTDTYDGLVKDLGPSMEPVEQDMKAVLLIQRRGALDLVKEGRINEAVARCAREWASLPGSPYGQPMQTIEQFLAVYQQYGGALAEAAAPSPSIPQEVKPMAPLILPLLEIASSLIPQLGKMFGSGTEVQQRNVAAASIVADSLVQATQAVNLQDAVEKIQNDPAALTAARQAVSDTMFQLGEAGGGGIDGARKSSLALAEVPLRRNTPFLVTLMFYPLIVAVVLAALLDFPWLAKLTTETRAMVVGFVLGTIAGSIISFFFGTTKDSSRKTDLLAVK
jgi:muramidase (phage lysozyme)